MLNKFGFLTKDLINEEEKGLMKKYSNRMLALSMAIAFGVGAIGCSSDSQKKPDKVKTSKEENTEKSFNSYETSAIESLESGFEYESIKVKTTENKDIETECTEGKIIEDITVEDISEAERKENQTIIEETVSEETKDLTDIQRNSISMLNYLTVLTKEINDSKNSKLFLEEAYSSLLNNTYPNAVDNRTLVELTDLLDTLEKYRMISVKRERLQFIYEQNCAQALRAAVPNPLGLISAVTSADWKKLVASVVYMAMDSYTSYTAYTAENNLQFIKDGWALDDAQAEALHNSRSVTFSYMIEMVQKYSLPGDLTLTEKVVDEFVQWKNEPNVTRRIRFLESNSKTYQAFGEYWLTLAESYYEADEYKNCLNAISSYESLNTRIFRKDYNYARILPLGIVAAEEEFSEEKFITTAELMAERIVENTDQTDWKLRYFAAQTYLNLYGRTGNIRYAECAYEIVFDNVNQLVKKQQEFNATFLASIKKEVADKDATEEQKEEIDNYNKQLEEVRKTELPPIYEPLLVNCELMFALADELSISEVEKKEIDSMLHGNGSNIFLVSSLDNQYRFNNKTEVLSNGDIEASMKRTTLRLPAMLVTGKAKIKATVHRDGKIEMLYEDWTVKEVNRKEKDNPDTYQVIFESELLDDFKYQTDDIVEVTIIPNENCVSEEMFFRFKVEVSGGMPDFWNTYVSFEKIS